MKHAFTGLKICAKPTKTLYRMKPARMAGLFDEIKRKDKL
jgi:hypothetical protein